MPTPKISTRRDRARATVRALLYSGLVVLYLLHNDWWLWNRDDRVFGLPVGLAYHVAYSLLIVVWMALMVRFLSPAGEPAAGAGESHGGDDG